MERVDALRLYHPALCVTRGVDKRQAHPQQCLSGEALIWRR